MTIFSRLFYAGRLRCEGQGFHFREQRERKFTSLLSFSDTLIIVWAFCRFLDADFPFQVTSRSFNHSRDYSTFSLPWPSWHLKLPTISFAASAYIAGSSGLPGNVSRTVQSGSTFLHSLIKLTNKTNRKLQNFSSPELDTHLAVFRAMFNLLSNLALSAECRGVMWKVGCWAYHVNIFTYTAWHDVWLFSVSIENANARLSFYGPKCLQAFSLCVLRILILLL